MSKQIALSVAVGAVFALAVFDARVATTESGYEQFAQRAPGGHGSCGKGKRWDKRSQSCVPVTG